MSREDARQKAKETKWFWDKTYKEEDVRDVKRADECNKNTKKIIGNSASEIKENTGKDNSRDTLSEKQLRAIEKLESKQIDKVKGSGNETEALKRSIKVREYTDDEGEWVGSVDNPEWLP